jgi:flavin-binding protein dodecin
MADKVYKKITVVGCSTESYEKAIETAVSRASDSVRNIAWFEVKEFRGGMVDGAIEWQATIDVAFKVE